MRIYLASSWKNSWILGTLADSLRAEGHEVDCFCDPTTGRFVFDNAQLPDIAELDSQTALTHPGIQRAFEEDRKWIDWADTVLMILPCGKSAHLEAGYAKGSGKELVIYQPEFPKGEFDVMYGFADLVTDNWSEVKAWLLEARVQLA